MWIECSCYSGTQIRGAGLLGTLVEVQIPDTQEHQTHLYVRVASNVYSYTSSPVLGNCQGFALSRYLLHDGPVLVLKWYGPELPDPTSFVPGFRTGKDSSILLPAFILPNYRDCSYHDFGSSGVIGSSFLLRNP